MECKCQMSEKQSYSIKKEILDKNREEAFSNRLNNSALAFNFGPDSPNYYVISEIEFIKEQSEFIKSSYPLMSFPS